MLGGRRCGLYVFFVRRVFVIDVSPRFVRGTAGAASGTTTVSTMYPPLLVGRVHSLAMFGSPRVRLRLLHVVP